MVLKVGIVAGEKSGDYLGAELIKAISARYPDAQFIGLAGPLMQQAGAKTLAEMDKISIMGIAGALKGLREILAIRRTIKREMLSWKPDVFIGIDVPDFNLGLELMLKQSGIPTVHYVSPTVWAWRGKRIKKIRKAVSLMLTLFPFEEQFYQAKGVRVKYVGHPLASPVLRWQVSDEVRAMLLPASQNEGQQPRRMVAVLPGSRMSEVSRLAPIMLAACEELADAFPDLDFVIPAANAKIADYLTNELSIGKTRVRLIDGHSRDALALCHVAVLASGTAALEAALFAKPMVVMYKVSKINEWYASRTMTVSHYSMPNHLVSPPIVPELIQDNATSGALVAQLTKLLTDDEHYQHVQATLATIAPSLSESSGELACNAIEALLNDRAAELNSNL
ncbi:lipid-A-disaccharide synthase [Arenicella xantha]|uniref:Lipid-A-disaccharide synthase n=1 Tax=Arenicella xantha TaxID=644221 RepID=A0A395JM54_9GAMM|nr:lipid-A-disaccharide synthase [Arenicella xantha]RBP50937.1 lipid-A-disaccharide synthase [Arenicella xantha]